MLKIPAFGNTQNVKCNFSLYENFNPPYLLSLRLFGLEVKLHLTVLLDQIAQCGVEEIYKEFGDPDPQY